MTPEERAVIEAACEYGLAHDYARGDPYNPATKLIAAVRALRESQKPAPRYYVDPPEMRCNHEDDVVRDREAGGRMRAICPTRADAVRIAAALNAQDKP